MSDDYTDLIERLRKYPCWSTLARLMDEAAAAISALVAENAGWKAGYENLMRDNDEIKAKLRAERDAAVEALRNYLNEYEGVYDSVGRDGASYQSETAKRAEQAARAVLAARQPTAQETKP
jgi:predicted phage gp36 major capsid-like protein